MSATLSYMSIVFFFNDTATTEIYTLSLHDALPILRPLALELVGALRHHRRPHERRAHRVRSEEHTSELQSPDHLVCRLLLEKKNIVSILIPWTPLHSTRPAIHDALLLSSTPQLPPT